MSARRVALLQMKNPLDEFIIERFIVSVRHRRMLRHSAARAAFSVALGRIAADALASLGR